MPPELHSVIPAIATVIVGLAGFLFGPREVDRRVRKLERLAATGEHLGSGAASKVYDQMMAEMLERFREEENEKADRRVNGSALSATIFIALLFGGMTYVLVVVAQSTSPFWSLVSWVGAILVGVFGLLLVIAGLMSTTETTAARDQRAKKRAAKKSASQRSSRQAPGR